MTRLIQTFERTATDTHAPILARMDAELRYGPDAVLDHVFKRYQRWRDLHQMNSAAVRLAEGEFFREVQHAIHFRAEVVEAIERLAGQRT